MKKIIGTLLSTLVVLQLTGCDSSGGRKTNSSTSTTVKDSNASTISSTINSTVSSTAESQADIPPQREEATGKSDKPFDFSTSPTATKVKNDVTGRWRYTGITEAGIDISEYALDYYKKYFKSDDEVHAVINFSDKTTTRFNCFGNTLFVDVLKYVDKEERDADLLFSGDYLRGYIIYTDNGDIEPVTDA